MTVKKDIRRDTSKITETKDGFRHVRVFDVDALGSNSERLLLDALEQGDIPKIGDPHPFINGIFCLDRESKQPPGTKSARVTCTYGVEDAAAVGAGAVGGRGLVEFFADVVTETVTTDINGDMLITIWTGVLQASSLSTPQEFLLAARRHRVEVDRPTIGVRLRRKESQLSTERILAIVGSVNASTWSGSRPKTWLCRSVDSSENTDGSHQVSYTFTYKPDTWQVLLTTRIENEIPLDVVEGNGIALYDVYPLFDFNSVGIGF